MSGRRLLLTSAGLRNDTLRSALAALVGVPFAQAHVVVVLTASLAEPGDKRWLLADLVGLESLGWATFDLVDLHTIPGPALAQRLRAADVVYVHGGNHYNLLAAIERRHLAGLFEEILATRVYVGVSAGSMILSARMDDASARIFDDAEDAARVGLDTVRPALRVFDWYLKPHLDSPSFPERSEDWARARAAAADFPVWYVDDESALRITGAPGAERVEVVGEGRALLLGD